MYIYQIRAPDISEICNDAEQYRTAFLAAGCQAVASGLKSIFSDLITVASKACRFSIQFLNPSALETLERSGR